jgi:ubiquinol-cytochrome c reductase cytochrome c subunit
MKHFVAVALIGSALHGAAFAQSDEAARPSAASGEAVYMRIGCYACHGTVGHGGAGPRLAPNTLPLEAFKTWVRNGSPGWSIARGMPAFSTRVLTDGEVGDIHAYLASLPAPPAAKDIELFDE